MNTARRRFLVSLGLAMLLHLALPLAIWWLLTAVPPEREPAVSMVELISLPPEPEAEPEKADAVANANQSAKSEAKPDVPPPAPAPAPQAGPMPMPKPVARPATPKPVAKPIAKATPATVPDEPPPTPEEPPKEAEETPPEPEKPVAKPPPPRPAKPAPVQERPSKAPSRQTKDLANTPLNLNPSVESLSRWDMNRRHQAQAAARDEEVVDLNTRQSRYVSYFAQVKQRIEMAWIYPLEAKRDKLSGNVGLTFTIQRSGQLLEARVTRSSEMAVLDEAALQAVNKATPFAPFPDDWTLEKLTIRATFEYIRRELSWQQ